MCISSENVANRQWWYHFLSCTLSDVHRWCVLTLCQRGCVLCLRVLPIPSNDVSWIFTGKSSIFFTTFSFPDFFQNCRPSNACGRKIISLFHQLKSFCLYRLPHHPLPVQTFRICLRWEQMFSCIFFRLNFVRNFQRLQETLMAFSCSLFTGCARKVIARKYSFLCERISKMEFIVIGNAWSFEKFPHQWAQYSSTPPNF